MTKNNHEFKLKGKIVDTKEIESMIDEEQGRKALVLEGPGPNVDMHGLDRMVELLEEVKNNKEYTSNSLMDKVKKLVSENGDVTKEASDTAELMGLVSIKESIEKIESVALELGKLLGIPDHIIIELALERFRTSDTNQQNYFNEFSINNENLKGITKQVVQNEISMYNDEYDKMNVGKKHTLRETGDNIQRLLSDKSLKSMNNIKDIDDDEIMEMSLQSVMKSYNVSDMIENYKCDGAFTKCDACIGLSDEGICEITGQDMKSESIKVCNDFEDK